MTNDDLKILEIESATFQRILSHLRDNPDVQNIDLMNLANFCRNCISKWYAEISRVPGEGLKPVRGVELRRHWGAGLFEVNF